MFSVLSQCNFGCDGDDATCGVVQSYRYNSNTSKRVNSSFVSMRVQAAGTVGVEMEAVQAVARVEVEMEVARVVAARGAMMAVA